MHDKTPIKLQISTEVQRHLRVTTPLLMLIFLILTSNYVTASTYATLKTTNTATVRAVPVTLASGNSWASSIAATADYASIMGTAGLTFNQNANLLTPTQAASPSADGSQIAQFNGATSGSCSFSTGTANDVLYVAVSILGSNAASSVTDSTGSALTRRAAIANTGVRIETWYKTAATLGSQNITVTFTSSTTFAIIAMGIKNANPQNPFDGSSANPATGSGTGIAQSVSVSSMLSNTLVIGAVAVAASVNPSAGTGFTNVKNGNSGGLGEGVETKSLTATVTSSPITYTTTSPANWAMIGDVIWGKLPSLSVNTGFATPTTGGNTAINNNVEAYLVSPAYPRSITIYAGNWTLNLWAKAATAGDAMEIIYLATDASYNIVGSLGGKSTTGPVAATTSLVPSSYQGQQVTVPSGGHLIVILSNINGASKSFTVYWGTQGLTNFQTPRIFNYITKVVNSGTSTASFSLLAYGYSSISRLTNLTIYVYSPYANGIVISNGVVSQSSSAVYSIPSGATYYVAANATATDFNSISNVVLALRFNSARPFSYEYINMTIS